MPHDKSTSSPTSTRAGPKVEAAVKASAEAGGLAPRALGGARGGLPSAAELLAGPWRDTLNAATMLGQSKTAHQAEIDAACEAHRLLALQPRS